MTVFRINSSDGKTKLYCQEWVPEGKPRAILQIIHGMNEYIDRYKDFAEWLCSQGIMVVGDDHIGHGHSVSSPDDFGYFGSYDGWKHMVEDEHIIRKYVQESYPDIPYIMLGHSFGSFIMRGYLATQDTTGLSGAIVMGTAGSNPALGAGLTLTKALRKLQGERKRSKLITAMAFGSYTKRIDKPVNHYAWLTHDDSICLNVTKDDLYMYTFTLAGYEDMFNILKFVNSDEWYQKVPKNLPILLCAGWDDPVGNYGKGPAEVCDRLEEAGCNTNMVLYENMRHEILNEIGKDKVWDDMLGYILDMADGICDVERGFECDFEG